MRHFAIDYLIKDGDIDCFRILMTECLGVLRKLECDTASIWVFNKSHFREELLKHFGFKSSIKFPYDIFSEENYFIAQCLEETLLEKN